MPAMTSVVMTGRRMNSSVKLMSRSPRRGSPWAWSSPWTPVLAGGGRRGLDLPLGPRPEPELAVGDPPVTGPDLTAGQHREVARGARHGDGPGGRGAVGLNHEHEVSLLARDHRRGRDHQ